MPRRENRVKLGITSSVENDGDVKLLPERKALRANF